MVVVEFYTKDLVAATKLSKGQAIEGLTSLGAPTVESEDKQKLIVELTPNRIDWVSLEGVARSLLLFYKKRKPSTYTAENSKYEIIIDKSVTDVRPYTIWAVAKGLDFGGRSLDYLIQLQDKLNATIGRKVKKAGIGFYPLEKITFPIRYTAMKPEEIAYRPLNYPKKATAKEILEKHPKGIEYGQIISGAKNYPVFLDANNNILCLVPICNAKEYGEVTASTTDVAIEVSGTDLETVSSILDIICCSLADAGAKIYKVKMSYPKNSFYAPLLKSRKVNWDLGFANKVLGLNITTRQAEDLLRRMDIVLQGKTATSPPYRIDVMHTIDVAEDLAIVYGYNNFKLSMPNFFSSGKRLAKADGVHEIMRAMGFMEIKTPILTDAKQLDVYGMKKPIEILNPVSIDYTTARPSLLPGLFNSFFINKMKSLPQKLYEIGEVQTTKEELRLVFGLIGINATFADLRGHLQTLLKETGKDFEIQPIKEAVVGQWLDSTQAGELLVNKKPVGLVGKVKKEFLLKNGIEFPVFVCELSLGRGD